MEKIKQYRTAYSKISLSRVIKLMRSMTNKCAERCQIKARKSYKLVVRMEVNGNRLQRLYLKNYTVEEYFCLIQLDHAD